MARVHLTQGWYRIRCNVNVGSHSVDFYDEAVFQRVETKIMGHATDPVWLEDGKYLISLIVAPRTQLLDSTDFYVESLTQLDKLFWLSKRIFNKVSRSTKALRDKLKIGRVARPIQQQVAVCFDQSVKNTVSIKIYVSYAHTQIELSEAHKIALDRQTYKNFTLDAGEAHDVHLVIAPNMVLTADALSIVANFFVNHEAIDYLVADVWCGQKRTTRVAFDPLIYGDGTLPTPFATRADRTLNDTKSWIDLACLSGVVSVPIAYSNEDVPPKAILLDAHRPLVSIIIPTRDRADLLKKCLKGLFEATDWPHEVIIVDNGSEAPETFELFEIYGLKGLRVVRYDAAFNFATLCNLGARAAGGEFLVFMNNDIEVMDSQWLTHMMALAQKSQIGAVGAKLYYPDKSLQHGGIGIGFDEICAHMWRHLSYEKQKSVPALEYNSLRSAVTAALMCIARNKFDLVGGFDDMNFGVTMNDVALCFKLREQGLFIAFAAKAEAFHHEGQSRGLDLSIEQKERRMKELKALAALWPDMIKSDPWLSEAYSRASDRLYLR